MDDPREGLSAITDRLVRETWKTIPDSVSVSDALVMQWGGERNLTLRKALGMPLDNGEVCMVNQGHVIQLVVAGKSRARKLATKLRAGLPDEGWELLVTRRPDREWLVTAYPE